MLALIAVGLFAAIPLNAGADIPPLQTSTVSLYIDTPVAGEATTLEITIGPDGGAVVPAGSVTITVDSAEIGTAPVSGGGATFTDSNGFTQGPHTFQVDYGGDSNFAPGSTGPQVIDVSPIQFQDPTGGLGVFEAIPTTIPTMTLSGALELPPEGSGYAVFDAPPPGLNPTGPVVWHDYGPCCGAGITLGTSSIYPTTTILPDGSPYWETTSVTVTLQPGLNEISGDYNGDNYFSSTVAFANWYSLLVAPSLSNGAPTSTTVGSYIAFDVIGGGTPLPTVTVQGSPPPGVTMSGSGNVLSFQGPVTTPGTYSMVFTADNGVAPDATQTVTVEVSPAPPAPQLPSFASMPTVLSAAVGSPYSYAFSASGVPAPTLIWTANPVPGLAFDAATGTLAGTPTRPGVYQLGVEAANSVGSTSASTLLDVVGSSTASASGYWMAGEDGTIYPFGTAPPLQSVGAGTVSLAATPTGLGLWSVTAAGVVTALGDAPYLGGRPSLSPGEAVTSISGAPDGQGYWLFTNTGQVFPYGTAGWYGDLSGRVLNGGVVASVATISGHGYYMVAADGGVFAFGDAVFQGSMGGHRLNRAIVGVASSPSGGYWLVASDGGIFAFGDAPFRGSMGGTPLNKPIIGMVAYGDGYLMVASDGGIFDYSSAPFAGSLGSTPPTSPVVGVAPS